ncbi:hypothetical protein [Nocardia sp. NPDC052566]|uniref:hypothetical protein n=1 Tax=Nocardia sp. NPDC052566 TaxID=3364330 RepID=UPI0037C9D796
MDRLPAGLVRLLLRRGIDGAAGGILGLVEFWDRFGAALDYDLLERGIDIRDCFGPNDLRTRDWRTIWRFKDRLPRGSQYKTALAMDRAIAEEIIALELNGDGEGETSAEEPTPDGYTLDTYLLLGIIDAVQGVQAAVIAAAGADPPAIRPMPRPITALDTVREEARLRSMQSLIDEFIVPASVDADRAV